MQQHDEVWLKVEEAEFEVRIYRPDGDGPFPAILDVHGGAWTTGDRSNGVLYNQALAESGFLVAAIDFRDGPEHQHPAASNDVANAIRWLHLNAERLGADMTPLGLLGSSSGGHLVLHAAVTSGTLLDDNVQLVVGDQEVTPTAATPTSANYVIALWPVSDPFYRYRYATRVKRDSLVKCHDDYFVTEDAMRAASVPRIVVSGEATELPPALVVQPGEDANVPIEMTFDLLRSWQSRGGYIEYAHFPGQPHAFGHRPSAATSEMIELVIAFAKRQVGCT